MQLAINELEHTREILQNNYSVGEASEAQQTLRLNTIRDIDTALEVLKRS